MSESFKGLEGDWTLFTEGNSLLPADYVLAPFTAVHETGVWINAWISHGLGVPARKHGLFLTNGVDWLEYKFGEHGLPTVATKHMAVGGHDRLWLSVPYTGVCCFDGHSTVSYAFGQAGLPGDMVITDLRIDEEDRVWLATLGQGIYRFSENDWRRISGDVQALGDSVVAFGVDRRSLFWLACEDRKETRFVLNRSGFWELVCSFPLGSKQDDEVACFAVDSADRIWVGRRRGGLMVWEGQRWQRLTTRDCPLLFGEIQSLTIDERDNLWAGTAGGYAVYDGNQWHDWGAIRPGTSELAVSREELLSADSETVSRYVYIGGFIAIDGMGRKWLNSAKGLVMFTPWPVNGPNSTIDRMR